MLRILIVEDEPAIQLLLERVLDGLPGEIVPATNVAEARLRLQEGEIHVALCAKNLPDGNGLDLIRELKQRHPDSVAILMTAYASLESAIEAIKVGAFDYLQKPFENLARVALTVQHAIDKVRLRQSQAELNQQLRDSEQRYALAAIAANEGLWDWNLRTNSCYFSPRWWHILGEDAFPEAPGVADWLSRVHPDDAERLERSLTEHLEGRAPQFALEYRVRHKSGGWLWVLNRATAVRDEAGKPYRMTGSQIDVTERRQADEKLRHDALHDGLTGLPNPVLFRQRLDHALSKSRRRQSGRTRSGHTAAVLFLDLDRFKNVNDSLGHVVGDQLLIAFAQRLGQCLREVDTFARMGGDEFAILLDDLDDIREALDVAGRLQLALERPFKLDGHEVFAAASIGITLLTADQQPDDVLREADTAMYRAKAHGRGRYEVFDQAMHAAATELLAMQTDLRMALDRHEFRLEYQPIVRVKSGRIVGFEALLRWRSPARGDVGPADFIPVAEEMGLIKRIGSWVLREACAQMKAWQQRVPAARGLFMSVNISSRQFIRCDLAAEVQHILTETGLDGHSLKLEITESALIEDVEITRATLLELKALDVRLALDDFGTGYSSLSSLHRLPFDSLKIDRSFVNRLQAGQASELVGTIVVLARSMGMDAIAEGIETAAQAKRLEKLGCAYAQGYFYSRPVAAEAVPALLPRGIEMPRSSVAITTNLKRARRDPAPGFQALRRSVSRSRPRAPTTW